MLHELNRLRSARPTLHSITRFATRVLLNGRLLCGKAQHVNEDARLRETKRGEVNDERSRSRRRRSRGRRNTTQAMRSTRTAGGASIVARTGSSDEGRRTGKSAGRFTLYAPRSRRSSGELYAFLVRWFPTFAFILLACMRREAPS